MTNSERDAWSHGYVIEKSGPFQLIRGKAEGRYNVLVGRVSKADERYLIFTPVNPWLLDYAFEDAMILFDEQCLALKLADEMTQPRD